MDEQEQRYYRRVIRIRATDSPNVILGLRQKAAGMKPDNRIVVPGVITYDLFRRRVRVWDKMRKCIGLHARFYLGVELLLFPPDWLANSEDLHVRLLDKGVKRFAKSIGADVARGGDSTSFCACDEYGVIELKTWKTPDSSVIRGELLAFARKHGVPDQMIWIDTGGGGGQIADEMRRKGHRVKTVFFGAAPTRDVKPGQATIVERQEVLTERYTYKNLRAQMYHELHMACDPNSEFGGFAIPPQYERLIRELAPMPKLYDGEGRIVMLPKDRDALTKENEREERAKTLKQLIGWSPDEADATVLAYHGIMEKKGRKKISAA